MFHKSKLIYSLHFCYKPGDAKFSIKYAINGVGTFLAKTTMLTYIIEKLF